MTSKELTELIHQNTRIILPEFGAFLVKDGGDKGFNPANVSFSPFLRYNDGMLEVYVAKKLVISKDEASKVVREFVESIKNELLEKGFFVVDGLGELRRDQRGSLSFSLLRPEEIQKSIKVEAPKEEPSPISSTVSEKSAEQNDTGLIEESAEDKKPKKITGEKAKIEKLSASKKIKKTSIVVEEPPMETSTIELDSTLEIEPNNSDSTQPDQELIIETPKELESNEEKVVMQFEDKSTPILEIENTSKNEPIRKGRFTGLVYTAIAIIVAVILFFVVRSYYFPPNIESGAKDNPTIASEPNTIINEKVDAKEKVDKPKDEIDNAFNEEPSESKPSKEEQLKKEKEQEDAIANTLIKNAQATKIETKKSSGIKFYIIAGSFKNPDFANKFVNELKKSGYDASIVVQPSGMNAVYVGSYSSHDEANKALKEFKSKLPNLWILKK